MSKEKRMQGYCEYCNTKLGVITVHLGNLLVEEIFCDLECLEMFQERERSTMDAKCRKDDLLKKIEAIYNEISYLVHYPPGSSPPKEVKLFKMIRCLMDEIRDNKIEFKK